MTRVRDAFGLEERHLNCQPIISGNDDVFIMAGTIF